MADEVVEMELDFHTTRDDDHFESDFDDRASSIDDKQGGSNPESSQQTSTVVEDAEKLSDGQVLEAMNKLLKVCIMSHFACLSFLSSSSIVVAVFYQMF